MLRQAGLAFDAIPSNVDETAIKQTAAANGATATHLALTLAQQKAGQLSVKFPAALVIGADQLLVCGKTWFDKPANLAAAATHLQTLRGKPHELVTAVCVYHNGKMLWHHIATPTLTMRNLSDNFITSYLAAEGETVCSAVGAYRLEGLGIQLFEAIEGDFFTILGLPLLALLGFLRAHGALAD